MKIDYSKGYFTQDEKEHLNKERALALTKNPNYIPIIVLIDSNVLRIDKHKFLVSEDMTVQDYFNSLKKKLVNLSHNDSLVYSITHFSNEKTLTPLSSDKGCMSLKQLYNQFKDHDTNMLILTISRQTTYKWVKSIASYYMGY
jgi:hypothetical protein